MNLDRFQAITDSYATLRLGILGDFCLDRYLEIDPAKAETSLETGLPVHNVVHVRAQPGGAGTILNNLCALQVGHIYPIGFAGDDGEGYELSRALEQRPGVRLGFFLRTVQRRTFTYCKPLVLTPQKPPVELNRLDLKNWTPTPSLVQGLMIGRLLEAAKVIDALIVLDQVDIPETGVVTQRMLSNLGDQLRSNPDLLVLADSRRGLRGFPPVVFKMNAAELAAMIGARTDLDFNEIKGAARELADANHRAVFVTLAERGMIGAGPGGQVEHVPALPVRGEIDIVGAGDAVSANLAAALAAGASLLEALELASAAAAVVIHKLGTTGTATILELREKMTEEGLLPAQAPA
ncbi:MAG TPA: PfkB family carbohydrate kinase [Dongiaceae bacterium]|nr:PfkB family carbohydrate kinase [Dongiaceae bacterium]